MKNRNLIILGIMLILLITIPILIIALNRANKKSQIANNNLGAYQDTVRFQKNKDSSTTATILSYESNRASDFSKIKLLGEENEKLKKLVEKYKSQLKSTGSAIIHSDSVSFSHTSPTNIISSDTVKELVYPTYSSDHQLGKWITAKTIANKDSTSLFVGVRNEYAVVIGKEKGKAVAWVTNYNPYSIDPTIKAVLFTPSPRKRLGIGGTIGYGGFYTDNQIKFGISGSVGLTYTFIYIK